LFPFLFVLFFICVDSSFIIHTSYQILSMR
jgi:hypothetical protein